MWIGGAAPATVAVAEELAVAVNLWDASPDAVARQATRTEVTWAGPPPVVGGLGPSDVGALVGTLARAGATWVVFGWPAPMEELVAGAERTHR